MNRGAIDTVLPNMFSNPIYAGNYLFYGHMIGQCSIVIDENLPARAGVSFAIDHYNLYINPTMFDEFTLVQQLGVLKHEMLHILNNHVERKEDREHLAFNYATDCAINQLIERNHLPGDAIYPDNFPVKAKVNESAEYYYELLKEEAENQNEEQECSKCGGSGEMEDEDGEPCTCNRCGGTGKEPGAGGYTTGTGELIDDHGKWEESEGDGELKKDLTKQMIERSMNETLKSKGNLPKGIEQYLKIFTRKSQVSWKKVLRNIVGNKRVNSRRTIMRSDRRFPKREDLRGKTKDRMFDLTVIVDVSGSMSDNEIMTGLNEIHNICKMTKTTMKLIQVDTVVHKVEEFSEKTKIFERSGCGGTIMEPAIDYIKKEKIPTDACILVTDGFIEDVSKWKNPPRYKMMFLTTDGDIPGIESSTRYKQFKLKI